MATTKRQLLKKDIKMEKNRFANQIPENPRTFRGTEKKEEQTNCIRMRNAVCSALDISSTFEDFISHLQDFGYEFERNEGQNSARIKFLNGKKWRNTLELGKEFTLQNLDLYIYKCAHGYHGSMSSKKEGTGELLPQKARNPLSKCPYQYEKIIEIYGPFLSIFLIFVYFLGGPDLICPKNPQPKYRALSEEISKEKERVETYIRYALLLSKNHIRRKEEALVYIQKAEEHLLLLARERQKLYNRMRNCPSTEKGALQEEVYRLSKELKPIRLQIADFKQILKISPIMEQQILIEEAALKRKSHREFCSATSENP